jgi:hypothetical protein
MFLIAFIVGVFSAILVKYKILDYAEHRNETPGKFWHYLHIAINIGLGISLIFLFWSWIVGLASIYMWIL